MTNSKQLHNEAGRLYRLFEIKTNDANKAASKAEDYEKIGNVSRATQESKLANRYYEDALRLEKLAIKYDNEAAALEAEALEIEQRQSRLQRTLGEQISKLEYRRKLLRGDI